MRLDHGAVVETKNALDNAAQVFGDSERARAAAVGDGVAFVPLKFRAKRGTQIGDRSGELDSSLRDIGFNHSQSVLVGEAVDFSDVRCICTGLVGQFCARQIFPIGKRLRREFVNGGFEISAGLASELKRDLDAHGGIHGADDFGAGKRLTITAWECDAFFHGVSPQ
jgi:hypothetical protein